MQEQYNRFATDRTIDLNVGTGSTVVVVDNTESNNSSYQNTQPISPYQIDKSSIVDIDIPVSGVTHNNRFALIIGNENYNELMSVDYALNDARMFKEYAIKVLGIPADHIIYQENATAVKFTTLITKASNLMNSSRELFVYYSGHGFPNENKETYLVPIDVNEDNINLFGIKLEDFYQELSKNNPARVTIFIDACFSGGGRNGLAIARTGVKRSPKDASVSGNIVVFTASTGDEVSQKYDAQKHGLFTYYLLKILKETKGDISYSELATKLQTQVKDRSNIEANLKEQNPKVNVGNGVAGWEDWRLK